MTVSSIASTIIQSYQNSSVPPEEPPPSFMEFFDAQSDLAAIFERSGKDEKAIQQKPSGPSDRSGALTRRLVEAKYQGEVYAIISEAHKNLSEWLEAAIGGDAKAMAAVRRLNKLIRRASRKVSDLNKEDILRERHNRAEKKQMEAQAAQIRAELKRKIAERKQREQGYMRSARQQNGIGGPHFPKPMSPAALEAKVMALAGAMQNVSTINHNTNCIQPGADIGSPSPLPPVSVPATE
jgi:hypothetical protein